MLRILEGPSHLWWLNIFLNCFTNLFPPGLASFLKREIILLYRVASLWKKQFLLSPTMQSWVHLTSPNKEEHGFENSIRKYLWKYPHFSSGTKNVFFPSHDVSVQIVFICGFATISFLVLREGFQFCVSDRKWHIMFGTFIWVWVWGEEGGLLLSQELGIH